MHGINPDANIHLPYVKRGNGGGGMKSVEYCISSELEELLEYLSQTKEILLLSVSCVGVLQ